MKTNVVIDDENYVTEVKVTLTPLEFIVMKKSLEYFIENNDNVNDTVIAWDMCNNDMYSNGKMLVCPNCGLDVRGDFESCPRCGENLKEGE